MAKKTVSKGYNPKPTVLGDNLRYLLERKGQTIKGMAEALGVAPQTAYFWVSGQTAPDSESRQKICAYFGVTEGQLFSKGMATGTQSTAESNVIHDLIVKLGLEGVAPEELERMSERNKTLIKEMIKGLLAGERAQRQAVRDSTPTSRNGKKTILLIDDEARLAQVLQAKLKEIGYDVYIAADGLEGFRRIEEHKPDLILMDLKMVGMDGLDFLRKFREEDRKTKVIIMSAFPDEIANVHAENLQIEGYFDKPVPLEALLDRVSKSIGEPS